MSGGYIFFPEQITNELLKNFTGESAIVKIPNSTQVVKQVYESEKQVLLPRSKVNIGGEVNVGPVSLAVISFESSLVFAAFIATGFLSFTFLGDDRWQVIYTAL